MNHLSKASAVLLVTVSLTGCSVVHPKPAVLETRPASTSAPTTTTSTEVVEEYDPVAAPVNVLPYEPLAPSAARIASHVKGPPRPQFTDASRVSYTDVPLLAETPLTEGDDESFWLVVVDKTSKSCGAAEPRQRMTWRFSRKWQADAVIRIDDFLLPPKEMLDGEYENPELFDKIIVVPYEKNQASTHISLIGKVDWLTLDRTKMTPDAAPVAHYQGRFADMSGHASKVSKGQASALLPGMIYAYRQCRSHCDAPLGSAEREEELGVIGPPSVWHGASADVVRTTPDKQAFTLLTVPVRAGSSASVLFDVMPKDVTRLGGPAPDGTQTTSFEVDLVWPEGEEPALEVFSGNVPATAEQLHEDRRAPYSAGGPCLY